MRRPLVLSFSTLVTILLACKVQYGYTDGTCLTCIPYNLQNNDKAAQGNAAINTSAAIPVNTSSFPLTATSGESQFLFCNNGSQVAAYSFGVSYSRIFGSVLCGRVYKFWKIVFYFGSNYLSFAAETFDRQGFALTVSVYYYDVIFASPEEASFFSYGITIYDIQVSVNGNVPNEKFDYFASFCPKVACPNKCEVVNNTDAFNSWWYPYSNPELPYFIWTAQFPDNDLGKTITASVFSFLYPAVFYISIDQFNYCFGNFLNSTYQPLVTGSPANLTQDDIVWYQSKGFVAEGFSATSTT